MVLVLRLVEQAAVVIGLGVVGTDRDRLVEIGERRHALGLLAVDDAAADVGDRIIGVDRERAIVVGERAVELLGLAIDQAAVGVGLRVVRIEADGLVEVGERLLVTAGAAEHGAAHVESLRIGRVALDHLGERGDVGRRRAIGGVLFLGTRGLFGERAAGGKRGREHDQRGRAAKPAGLGVRVHHACPIEHFPEKWAPVFRKKMRQIKNPERFRFT